MKEDAEFLAEYFRTIIGDYTEIKMFDRSLNPREGMGGFIKDVKMENNGLILDYTDENVSDYKILKIRDIESYSSWYAGLIINIARGALLPRL